MSGLPNSMELARDLANQVLDLVNERDKLRKERDMLLKAAQRAERSAKENKFGEYVITKFAFNGLLNAIGICEGDEL